MQSPENIIDRMEQILDQLSSIEDLLSSQDMLNLKNRVLSLKEKFREEAEKGRLLRLGIIGSVKAGKSTFLNALLFDCQNILPKAATPMTASLTKLRFSEQQFVKFVFYTKEDWNVIEKEYKEVCNLIDKEQQELNSTNNNSINLTLVDQKTVLERLRLPPARQACYELVQSARTNGLDLKKLLDSENTLKISGAKEAAKLLEDYVGSSGHYSPIVKYVEMGLNNPFLRDIEIVDTPGLNDIIRSRSAQTYEFLMQCNAVFMLSRASQFLSDEDLELLRNTLLNNGVTKVILIATQMDLGAQNEIKKTKSYKDAYLRSAKSVFNEAKKYEVQQVPIPISSMFETHAFKKENGLPLSAEDRKLEENLQYFSIDVPQTPAQFREYANFTAIRQEFKKCIQEKDDIIYRHQQDSAREFRRRIIGILNSLISGVNTDKKLLKENDYSSLGKLKNNLLELINNVEIPISNIFIDMEKEVSQTYADLKQRILENTKSFQDLNVQISTHQEEKTYTTGMLFWKESHYTTITVTTHTVELAEGLQLLADYSAQCEKDINNTVKELLRWEDLEEKLKQKILPIYRQLELKEFNFSVNEDLITAPIHALVNALTVPKISCDNNIYRTELIQEVDSNTIIENEKIHDFKTKFNIKLHKLCEDVRNKIDENKNFIIDKLSESSVEFTNKMRINLVEQLDKIEKQINNKEESIKQYENARRILEQCRKNI